MKRAPASRIVLCLAALSPQEPAVTPLPEGLALREEGPERYRFTCEYLATDAADAFAGKQRITAEYVRNLEGGRARWQGARLAEARGLDDDYPEGTPLAFMQAFEYRPSAGWGMFHASFFEGFPTDAAGTFARNLVWDTAMLEGFARDHWAALELNRSVRASGSRTNVPLAGLGLFGNRDLRLTWIGEGRYNDEPCALITYEADFNRFEMSLGDTRMRGLSHYQGLLWVSLVDLQLEHATLYEQVSLQIGGDEEPARRSVLRRGTLTHLVD
jgi:hypothetical protein